MFAVAPWQVGWWPWTIWAATGCAQVPHRRCTKRGIWLWHLDRSTCQTSHQEAWQGERLMERQKQQWRRCSTKSLQLGRPASHWRRKGGEHLLGWRGLPCLVAREETGVSAETFWRRLHCALTSLIVPLPCFTDVPIKPRQKRVQLCRLMVATQGAWFHSNLLSHAKKMYLYYLRIDYMQFLIIWMVGLPTDMTAPFGRRKIEKGLWKQQASCRSFWADSTLLSMGELRTPQSLTCFWPEDFRWLGQGQWIQLWMVQHSGFGRVCTLSAPTMQMSGWADFKCRKPRLMTVS